MAKISLLIPVRINERFSNFERYLQNIAENAGNINNLEFIFKFDDDQDISDALQILEVYKAKGYQIKTLITPRGRGYQDLSYFYTQMVLIASTDSSLFMVNSIDIIYKYKGFDDILIKATEEYQDGIFVIHPTNIASLIDDVKDINRAVQFVECFPCWSRKWIEIQGSFGYNSSSDGYTCLAEYFLFHEHGIDRRINITKHNILQETDISGVESDYWQGQRRVTMESLLSPAIVANARQAAKNLALNISNSWKKDDYINYLIQACLNSYDKMLIFENRIDRELVPNLEKTNRMLDNINSELGIKTAELNNKSNELQSKYDELQNKEVEINSLSAKYNQAINSIRDLSAQPVPEKQPHFFKRLEKNFRKMRDDFLRSFKK